MGKTQKKRLRCAALREKVRSRNVVNHSGGVEKCKIEKEENWLPPDADGMDQAVSDRP